MLIMALASIAEVISIGAVLPFLGALMAPGRVIAHPVAQPLIRFLHITTPSALLLPMTAIFVVAALLSGVMRLLLLWSQTLLSYAIGTDLGLRIYRHTLYQPYALHVSRNSSQMIAGISEKTHRLVSFVVMPVLVAASSALLLATVLGALITMDAFVTTTAIGGFGGIYWVIAVVTKRRLAIHSERISTESSWVIKALQEGLGGIRDVLIDGTQEVYCRIFRDAEVPLRRSQANVQLIGSSPRFLVEALGIAFIALLAYSLAARVQGVSSVVPKLGALAVGAQRMLPVLQQLYQSLSSVRGAKAGMRDVVELLEAPLPAYANERPPEPIPFTRAIALQGLGFRYTEKGPWVLRDMNIDIPRGSRVGVMGTTGSGKSTLLDVIMGLLTPTEGVIAIDGVPVTEKNHRAWQAHIAHVPQAIFLADTTIAENIAFGVPIDQIDQNRVRRAAQQAQIAHTIEAMAHAYDTFVGERGIRLSGGQRQRIGIARALYKKADVIVFDEATSALDNDTERAVMSAIESIGKDVTILIVAHRLTTLRGCDWIVELDEGRAKRVGTYEETVAYVSSRELRKMNPEGDVRSRASSAG